MKEQELPAHDLGKESQREEQGRAPWLGNQHGLLSRIGRLELMVRKVGVKRNRGRRLESWKVPEMSLDSLSTQQKPAEILT